MSLNRVSITADKMKQYASIVNFDEMVKADILLCYMSLFYPGDGSIFDKWFPELSCYNGHVEILPKMRSMRYFNKAKVLFGVDSVEEYKTKIEGLKDDIQNDGYHRIPNIKSGLSYEEVGRIS